MVYRKPTHTDLYVQWDSNHPLSAKLSVVSSLFHRASVVCRDENDLRKEQEHLVTVLKYNGYPEWFINKGRLRSEKKHSVDNQDKSDNTNSANGNVKHKSFVVMDYIRGLSERIRDILKCRGVQVYFKSSNTLRKLLVSPKDKDPIWVKQDVIYNIPCSYGSCSSSYIGETGRILEERIKDHVTDQNSAIRKHHLDTQHPLPEPTDKDIKILGTEPNAFKRRVKEAIFIKANNPDLNQNVGKFDLPPIYDQLLTGGGRDKLVVKTNVKDAIPKTRIKAIGSQFQIITD